jgi:hypothetical protein
MSSMSSCIFFGNLYTYSSDDQGLMVSSIIISIKTGGIFARIVESGPVQSSALDG